jgi:hypothetical protein
MRKCQCRPRPKFPWPGKAIADGKELSSSLATQSWPLVLCFFVNLSHSLPGVRAVIVPIESRMRAQDLDTTANDKGQEEKIEKVRRAQP